MKKIWIASPLKNTLFYAACTISITSWAQDYGEWHTSSLDDSSSRVFTSFGKSQNFALGLLCNKGREGMAVAYYPDNESALSKGHSIWQGASVSLDTWKAINSDEVAEYTAGRFLEDSGQAESITVVLKFDSGNSYLNTFQLSGLRAAAKEYGDFCGING